MLLQSLLDAGSGVLCAWALAFVLMRTMMSHPINALVPGTVLGALVPVTGGAMGWYYGASKLFG